ncbi:putative glycosyltransferase epsH [Fibrella aestuarina BUZ 2]|uniref:Putative glycosyltransferase epsH n=1 Tax=Fibrella aestuarina BUZ 2 TaxID=1166018 RepID=I0K944_9BACT|nr:glycosyltransferase family 2 protein [Fibrella aestuarina]CCH00647.1 putative glycosyltransferase epsH [Fibrella aestuarina BUZ 2]
MKQLPLVSVVLATYNGERFLKTQLDSIVQQTYPQLEVIVVDDRSTDATHDILQHYAARYPYFSLVVNETNLGYIRNFEKGMLLANGDLIALSDQDDIWHPEKIRILVEAMGDSDVVFGDSRLIDDNDQPLGINFSDIRQLQSFDSCLSFLIGNTVSGHNMLITKSLLQRSLPFPLHIPHDHWLCFVATFRQPVKFVPQLLVDYRQHATNVYGILPVVNGVKRTRAQKSAEQRLHAIRERAQALTDKCPAELTREKKVLTRLNRTYKSFSIPNNFVRMMTFFRYRDELLATKKRSALRKWLFCFKMFVKIK